MEKEMKGKTLKKLSKPRNFVAKDLFTPKYRIRVEHSSVNFYNRASEKQNFRKQNVYF
jgi:hypothetical protein